MLIYTHNVLPIGDIAGSLEHISRPFFCPPMRGKKFGWIPHLFFTIQSFPTYFPLQPNKEKWSFSFQFPSSPYHSFQFPPNQTKP